MTELYRHLQTRTQPTWPVVRVMVLLGSKYDAEKLYKEGIRELERKYPGDLQKLLEIEPEKDYMDFKYTDIVSIANVTRLLDRERLQLKALYDCCQSYTHDLLDGVTGSTAASEKLVETDLIRCLDGRSKL